MEWRGWEGGICGCGRLCGGGLPQSPRKRGDSSLGEGAFVCAMARLLFCCLVRIATKEVTQSLPPEGGGFAVRRRRRELSYEKSPILSDRGCCFAGTVQPCCPADERPAINRTSARLHSERRGAPSVRRDSSTRPRRAAAPMGAAPCCVARQRHRPPGLPAYLAYSMERVSRITFTRI